MQSLSMLDKRCIHAIAMTVHCRITTGQEEVQNMLRGIEMHRSFAAVVSDCRYCIRPRSSTVEYPDA